MNIRIIVFLMALLLFAGSAAADGTGGHLIEVNGKVWIQAPEADKKIARAGITLAPGTKILTGPDGKAEVSLTDGVYHSGSAKFLHGPFRNQTPKEKEDIDPDFFRQDLE